MRAAPAHVPIIKKAPEDVLQWRRTANRPPTTFFQVLPQRALEKRTFFRRVGVRRHPRLKSRELNEARLPATALRKKNRKTPAQWCLSSVHVQTRFSCKKLRTNLADRPACFRKRHFYPQQFVQRNCVSSGLLSLHHPKRHAALRTAIAFPQSKRRLPALHNNLRRQHLAEGAELHNNHVAYAVGIENLPTVSSPCTWPTTATHVVMRLILIDDWIIETLSRHDDWLRVALDSWGFSLYQLVGHPVKCKPPTLASCPAVLPQFFHK